ncbi:glycoside hydrolase family 18 protein, partial [Cylindrobasidium torrendii FP15055 ss-10]
VNPALRSEFVRSSVQLLEDRSLDGLDIGYTYPQNDQQAHGYVALLWELRQALDHHAQRKGANYQFLLATAAPCGTGNYQKLRVREMNQFLDFWNLTVYDFAVSQAANFYVGQGVPPANLIIGIPLYGRPFMNTQGPGQPFNGVGPGKWIRKMRLGGSMFWELSGDKGAPDMEDGPGREPQPGNSSARVVKDAMGGLQIDEPNWPSYEASKFDNMGKGMD